MQPINNKVSSECNNNSGIKKNNTNNSKTINDKLSTTLSMNSITPKDYIRKRVTNSSQKVSNPITDKVMDFAKKTLDKAYKEHDKLNYEKAAELYNLALSKNLFAMLGPESFHTIQKEVFICEMEIWKKSKCENKEHYLLNAKRSLISNLEGSGKLENKRKLFDLFVVEVINYSKSLIEKNEPSIAYKNLKSLFKLHLKFDKEIIDKKYSNIFNCMVSCIIQQESIEDNSSVEIINDLKILIKNPLINKDFQKACLEWLNSSWETDESDTHESEIDQNFEYDGSSTSNNVDQSNYQIENIIHIKEEHIVSEFVQTDMEYDGNFQADNLIEDIQEEPKGLDARQRELLDQLGEMSKEDIPEEFTEEYLQKFQRDIVSDSNIDQNNLQDSGMEVESAKPTYKPMDSHFLFYRK